METKESPLADKKARMRFNKAMREKGIPAKACGKCFVVKGLTQYRSRTASPDGLMTLCKPCHSHQAAVWRLTNSTRAAAYQKRYYAENRRRKDELNRRWKRENPKQWGSIRRQARQLRRAREAAATIVPFTHAEMLANWEEHDLYGCAFCGGPYEDIEHLVPLSKGGEHSIANLVPSCRDCNRGVGGKHSKMPWEWLSERYPELAPILVPSILPDVDPAP